MGNSNKRPDTTSMMDFVPAPSPVTYRNLPTSAPLIEGEMDHSDSVTSIHNEMSEILNMISRIIVNYIKDGQNHKENEASKAFSEQHYLKKKYV